MSNMNLLHKKCKKCLCYKPYRRNVSNLDPGFFVQCLTGSDFFYWNLHNRGYICAKYGHPLSKMKEEFALRTILTD